MNSSKNQTRYSYNAKKQDTNIITELSKPDSKNQNIIIQAPYNHLKNYLNTYVRNKNNEIKVLDYCCGNGDQCMDLIKKGIECYGIDLSPKSIEVCKDKIKKLGLKIEKNYSIGNAECMPYENNNFDIVVTCGSLSYLDFDVALKEITRVLKDDGVLIVVDTTKHNKILNIKRYIKYMFNKVSKYHLDNLFDTKKISKLTNRFQEHNITYYHLISLYFIYLPNTKFFNKLKNITLTTDLYLQKTFLRNFYWKFICILKNPK